MKTISTLSLRNSLGRVLSEVETTKQAITIVKNNRPVAKIVPIVESTFVFGQKKFDQLVAKLPPTYTLTHIDEDLLALTGCGEYIYLS